MRVPHGGSGRTDEGVMLHWQLLRRGMRRNTSACVKTCTRMPNAANRRRLRRVRAVTLALPSTSFSHVWYVLFFHADNVYELSFV